MKIQINNGAYTIKSDVKTETLRKLEKYNKSALTLFNEKDEPVIQDPLFEYWITKTYFERR